MSSRALVGYCRVSTDGQGDEGASLAAQHAALEGFARAQGAELAGLFLETGSARSLERPELRAALERARAMGPGTALAVVKLDRLTRSVRDLGELLAGPFRPVVDGGEGLELVAVRDSVDTHTAAGRLVLHVLVTVAQWEREAIAERTREALAHLRSSGSHLGRPPFGWRVTRNGPGGAAMLERDPREGPAHDRIVELSRQGRTAQAIADALELEGFHTRSGGRWSPKVVRLVLRRARAATPPGDIASAAHI
jgi:DNA invertase Pin-like site-specific DNA recombinase